MVWDRFRAAGLTMKAKKCMLFQTGLLFWIATDPHNVSMYLQRETGLGLPGKRGSSMFRLSTLLSALYTIVCAHCEPIDGHDDGKAIFYVVRYQREVKTFRAFRHALCETPVWAYPTRTVRALKPISQRQSDGEKVIAYLRPSFL